MKLRPWEIRPPQVDDDFWDGIAGIDRNLCPQQRVQFNEVRDVILGVVCHELTDDQRTAFLGRFSKWKKYREIAAEMGKTVNAVGLLIYGARKKLKHELEEAGFTLGEIHAIFQKGG